MQKIVLDEFYCGKFTVSSLTLTKTYILQKSEPVQLSLLQGIYLYIWVSILPKSLILKIEGTFLSGLVSR